MRVLHFFLFALILLISFQACVSKKEMLYLQDVESYNNKDVTYNNHRIQVDDILKISVGALMPEAALPYNSATAGNVVASSILPSYYREGTPRFLLESMACEKPIITTIHPGCDQLVQEHITGALCENKNIESLELAIKNVINSNYTKMGEQAREYYISHFSEDVVFDQIISFYYYK